MPPYPEGGEGNAAIGPESSAEVGLSGLGRGAVTGGGGRGRGGGGGGGGGFSGGFGGGNRAC